MIKNLIIYGSCVSRDIFNLDESRNFKLVEYYARSSMASLCSLKYENSGVLERIPSAFRRRMVENDFSKSLLSAGELIASADVILIDLIDERFDIVALPSGQTVTNSNELGESGLLNESSASGFRLIPQGTAERRELWIKGLAIFLSLLKEHDKLDRLIVNKVFWSSRFEKESETNFPVAQIFIERANAELEWMYGVLLNEIPESQFLSFPSTSLTADEFHRWGASPFHYCGKYYREALAQIISKSNISAQIKSDESLSTPPHSPLVSSGAKLTVAAFRTDQEIFAHCSLTMDGNIFETGCYAFYLIVNGSRHEVRWYNSSPSARFIVPDSYDSIEIIAFYKDILDEQTSAKCNIKTMPQL